jgi:hypothetical protein
MRPARVALSLFALLSLTAMAAAAPSDDEIRQKIVGSWGQAATCGEGHLTFNADGSFESAGPTTGGKLSGTYSIDGGRLSGQNGDNDMPVMLVDFDGDTLLLDNGSGDPERLSRCTPPQ